LCGSKCSYTATAMFYSVCWCVYVRVCVSVCGGEVAMSGASGRVSDVRHLLVIVSMTDTHLTTEKQVCVSAHVCVCVCVCVRKRERVRKHTHTHTGGDSECS